MLAIWFLLAGLGALAEAKLEILNFEVATEPSYILESHNLEQKNGKTKVSVKFDIQQPIKSGVTISGNLSIFRNGKYDPMMAIPATDLCKFLTGEANNVVLKIIHDHMKGFGNMPQKCPIEKKIYDITDYYLSETLFPMSLPNGKYQAEFHFEIKEKDKEKAAMLMHSKLQAKMF